MLCPAFDTKAVMAIEKYHFYALTVVQSAACFRAAERLYPGCSAAGNSYLRNLVEALAATARLLSCCGRRQEFAQAVHDNKIAPPDLNSFELLLTDQKIYPRLRQPRDPGSVGNANRDCVSRNGVLGHRGPSN